jgi:hypothetical protein
MKENRLAIGRQSNRVLEQKIYRLFARRSDRLMIAPTALSDWLLARF